VAGFFVVAFFVPAFLLVDRVPEDFPAAPEAFFLEGRAEVLLVAFLRDTAVLEDARRPRGFAEDFREVLDFFDFEVVALANYRLPRRPWRTAHR